MRRERKPEGRYKDVAELAALLVDGDKSIDELVSITGMHLNTVSLWCTALHHAGACHVTSWRQDVVGRWCIRIFKLGPGQDAACPAPMHRRKNAAASAPPPAATPAPARVATCWHGNSLYRQLAAP